VIRVETVNTIDNFSLRLFGAQLVKHVDPAKNEDVVLQLHLARSFGF
jgi:hypothetical protein